ncbi:MAG: hypothetical protein ABIG32_03655 [Candidatus Uhrbacteria bacterium]|nr:hypothetical protein [Patescibacteria group bacterium]MBU1907233.1 hypothetical protein [Patescibacteria group bacterium]
MSNGIKLPTKPQYKGAQVRIAKQKVLILEELEKSGIVTHACKKAGASSRSYYRWKRDDIEFAEKAAEAMKIGINIQNDVAESQLLRLVHCGDFKSIKYLMDRRHSGFNANYRLAELKCKLLALPSYDPEEIVLSPEDEAQMIEALGDVKDYQAYRAAQARNEIPSVTQERNNPTDQDL